MRDYYEIITVGDKIISYSATYLWRSRRAYLYNGGVSDMRADRRRPLLEERIKELTL